MPLVDLQLDLTRQPLPLKALRLIEDAQARIEKLDEERPGAVSAFVPSDFTLVYRALAAIRSERLSTGQRFLEWGSGIGTVTCLAESLGFDAVGFEIEPRLVTVAEDLAQEHGSTAEFILGSFVPPEGQLRLETPDEISWLSTSGPDGYAELQLDPDDFDLIFCYPWPGEEHTIFDLFAEYAAMGALLLTYHGQEGIRLQRKVR